MHIFMLFLTMSEGDRFMEVISKAIAQQIVDTVYDVCDQNINFIDEKGMIIASTDSGRVGTYHEVGYRAAMEGRTIEVTGDESYLGTRKGINIPIVYNDRVIAVIGISGDVEKIRKYAYLAQKITDILLKERELDALGVQKKNRLNYVIRSLISREPVAEQYLQDTLAENGLSGSSVCRVVLVQLNPQYNPNNLFMIQSAITQAFRQMGSDFYRYNYPNEYILIIEDQLLKKKYHVLRRLAETYREVLTIGVGQKVTVDRSDQSFQCARAAIACAAPDNNLVVYDDLDYDLLLSGVPEELWEQYCGKVTRKLSDEDRRILETYFAQDMSLQDTAAALFMHKNSLQYRLNHVAKITGYNPRKFKDAVVLYSALRLDSTKIKKY
jgi:carbohydrate diacid regulator